MNPFKSISFMTPHPALRLSGLVRLLALVVALCLPVLLAAPLPQTSWLATVGTTWRQPSGQDWAYLLYQSSDGTALAGRTVAVYRKDGEPNSPALFTRQAVTRLQDNPAVIAPLLDRSVNVGEDLNELAEHVTGLFQSLIPAPAVSLPERLAAVVQGLNADPSLHSRVLLLSRRHPGAALAFGMAWTEPLPAGIPAFTYELRDHDAVSGTDRAVIARVTIRPGAALVLPAPGSAVDIPTNSPQADLLARLRWSTPDPLRRLAPAQMGFNVYRIPTPVATTLGFTTNPPAAGVLATLARQATGVERVNEQPVVPPKEYASTDVADFALDPTTVFITDDRARFRGGPGFIDGDRFCYFVAARDILGRDGQYSPALCVTICDRVPPSAPRSVKVANDYLIEGTAGIQRLKVQWQPANEATSQKVARYAIFRWDDRNQMHEDGGKALPIGFVDHRPGTNKYTFIDRSPSAPTVAKDAGKVFWYTVRSVQDTACGPLLSPDSAPARGIPRDRIGPSGSPPNLTVREPVPDLKFRPLVIEGGGTNLPANARRFVLRATRTNREISWVEITVVDKSQPTGAATLGRHYFPPVVAPAYGSHATATTFSSMEWNYISTNTGPFTNIVSFGLANGLPSKKYIVVAPASPAGNFAGGVQMDLSLGWTNVPASSDHNAHYPRDLTPEKRAAGGKVSGVPIDMTVSVDARQWRIYRKLDDGPIAMIAEGDVPLARAGRPAAPAADAQIAYEDDSMPVNTAGARYYSQYLDADGNAGPMIASTTIAISTPPPPASALSLIPGDGGTNDPNSTMTLTWSAAPYGTARYRIWIGNPARVLSSAMIPVELVSLNLSGSGSDSRPRRSAQPAITSGTPLQLATTHPILPVVYRDFVTEAGITNLPCSVIDTTIVGGRVGVGPVYSNLLARASISADLYVLIEPVALDGTVGVASSTLVLRAGAGNVSTNPLVPWPRRPLPPARSNFTSGSPGFAAVRIKNGDLNGTNNADFNGIGVAIGTTTVAVKSTGTVALGRNAWINGPTDPDSLLFKDSETDLPILGQVITSGTTTRPPGIEMPFFLITQPVVSAVLYRQQVPSAAFPQPPGDIIQVSPMIDGIEYNTFSDPVTAPASPVALPGTRLADPFIGLFPFGKGQGLFLLDTQPIISGATYQYFLVRFDEYGEMIEVLPTNPVTATP
jgi:hypothetical protein